MVRWPPVLEIRVFFFCLRNTKTVFFIFTINDDGRRANIAFSISRSTCTGKNGVFLFPNEIFSLCVPNNGRRRRRCQQSITRFELVLRRPPTVNETTFAVQTRDRTTIGRKKSLTNDAARRFFRIAKLGCLPLGALINGPCSFVCKTVGDRCGNTGD